MLIVGEVLSPDTHRIETPMLAVGQEDIKH